MKKPVLLFIASVTWTFGLFAQGLLQTEWIITKTSSLSGGKSEAWGVDADDNGNIFWAVSMDSIAGQGLDIAVFKLNQDGTSAWSAPELIGGTGTQQCYVVHASDTFLYIGGRKCSGLINTCDMFLVKMDKTSGDTIWTKTWDSAMGYDEIDGLKIKDDGIYIGGWWSHSTAAYDLDIGLRKIDFNGNTIWHNTLGKITSAEHQDGHIVVDDSFIYAAGLWNGGSIANQFEGSSFLGKFSKTNGALVDSVLFGSMGWWINWDNALGMESDGVNLYLTGITTPATNDNQIFVACYDKSLNQKWFRYWGGSMSETARAIGTKDGLVYVSGATNSPGYNLGGGYDGCLLIYDTSGNFITYKIFGDARDNEPRDLKVTDNYLLLSGTSAEDMFGTGAANWEAFLYKVNFDSATSSLFLKENELDFSIFPNPTNGKINISLNLAQPTEIKLKLLDVFGKVLLSKSEICQDKICVMELNVPELLPGLYMCTVETADYRVARKILLN